MLIEHFNGHIRYGAAIAVGIACAGSGYKVGCLRLKYFLNIYFRKQLLSWSLFCLLKRTLCVKEL